MSASTNGLLSATERGAMEQLKFRMSEIPHIRFQTDDQFLLKYLRAFDWDIEKCLDILQKIYETRKKYPTWFAVKRVSEYMDMLRENQRYMLNGRDKLGRRMFVYKLGNTQPSTTIQDVAQMDDMWFECMLTEDDTQLNGIIVIIDFKDVPWYCVKWCQPKLIRIAADKSDLFPVKNFEVHVINPSTWLNTIIQTVRPMLSKSLRDRFQFHKPGLKSLQDVVGRDNLPPEYGGPAENAVNFDTVYNYLLEREDFIYNNRQYGII